MTQTTVLRVKNTKNIFWIDHGIMGRRFPDGELLRYRKLVPQQLGDVIIVPKSHEISADQSPSRNCISRPGMVVGSVFAVRAWS